MATALVLEILSSQNAGTVPLKLVVASLSPRNDVPKWATNDQFFSITRTVSGTSIICPESCVPADKHRPPQDQMWVPLRLVTDRDPTATGQPWLGLTAALAKHGVRSLVVSAAHGDFVLVKYHQLTNVRRHLQAAGHRVQGPLS